MYLYVKERNRENKRGEWRWKEEGEITIREQKKRERGVELRQGEKD